jgi:nucleotide-binding universal stress UspA family protein
MNKILVALDGSPRAETVLAAAIGIARETQSKLILFRSFALPPAIPANAWALPDGSVLDLLRKDAQTYLDATAKTVPKELLEKAEVVVGIPWQAVCDHAKAEDVSLIVIGSHGYSGLDHVLGTTAAKIVNHADRSVLVVRKPR